MWLRFRENYIEKRDYEIRLQRNTTRYLKSINEMIRKKTSLKKGDLIIVRALLVRDKNRNISANLQIPFETPNVIKTENGENNYIRIKIKEFCKLRICISTKNYACMEIKFQINIVLSCQEEHSTLFLKKSKKLKIG